MGLGAATTECVVFSCFLLDDTQSARCEEQEGVDISTLTSSEALMTQALEMGLPALNDFSRRSRQCLGFRLQ